MEPVPDVSQLYNKACELSQIQDKMSLENFLNPSEEDAVMIEEKDTLEAVISYHTGNQET